MLEIKMINGDTANLRRLSIIGVNVENRFYSDHDIGAEFCANILLSSGALVGVKADRLKIKEAIDCLARF